MTSSLNFSLLIIQSKNESLSLINSITESPVLVLTTDIKMNKSKELYGIFNCEP